MRNVEVEKLSKLPLNQRVTFLTKALEARRVAKSALLGEGNDAITEGFRQLRDTTRNGVPYQREFYPNSVTRIELNTPERDSEEVKDLPKELKGLINEIKLTEYTTKSEAILWAGIKQSPCDSLVFGGTIGKENFELLVRLNSSYDFYEWGTDRPTFGGFGSGRFESALDKIKKADYNEHDIFTSQLIALGLVKLVNDLRRPEFVIQPQDGKGLLEDQSPVYPSTLQA